MWPAFTQKMWYVARGPKKLPTPGLDRTDITPSLILNYGLHVINADVLLPTAHKKKQNSFDASKICQVIKITFKLFRLQFFSLHFCFWSDCFSNIFPENFDLRNSWFPVRYRYFVLRNPDRKTFLLLFGWTVNFQKCVPGLVNLLFNDRNNWNLNWNYICTSLHNKKTHTICKLQRVFFYLLKC